MLSQLVGTVTVAAQTAQSSADALPSPIVVGIGFFIGFMALMFATMAFTSLGKRHAAVDEHIDPHRQYTNKHEQSQRPRH